MIGGRRSALAVSGWGLAVGGWGSAVGGWGSAVGGQRSIYLYIYLKLCTNNKRVPARDSAAY